MDLVDLEAEAKSKIEDTFYDYIAGGAEDELTLDDNEAAWSRFKLRPRVLRDVRTIDTSTTTGATATPKTGTPTVSLLLRIRT